MPTVICAWGSLKIVISKTHAPIKMIPMTKGTNVRDKKTFLPGEDRFFEDMALLFFDVFFGMACSVCVGKRLGREAYVTQV
jgi:hypothetical protein